MKKTGIAFFTLVTLFGFYLRWHEIGKQSLWLDEIFSVTKSSEAISVFSLFESIRTDVHPPGYQLILYYWIKIFGNSEFSVRVLSALANILSISCIGIIYYKMRGKNLLKTLALVATLSSNYILVLYSQEARSYSLLASLGSVLLLLSLLRTLSEGEKNLFTISIPIIAIFTSSLHYAGLLWTMSIIGPSALYAISRKNRKEFVFWSLTAILSILPLIPWLIYSLTVREIKPMDHIPPADLRYLFFIPFYFYLWGIVVVVPLFIFLSYRGLSERRKNREFLYIFSVIIVFIAVLIIMQEGLKIPMINFRNLITISPAVLLSFFLIEEFEAKWKLGFFYIAICTGILIQTSNYIKTFKKAKKAEYREASRIALKWKKEIRDSEGQETSISTAYPEIFGYYLPAEKLEDCLGTKHRPAKRIIFINPASDPLGKGDLHKCQFSGYQIEREDKGAYDVEVFQYKRK